jgi:hypothetical protein
LDCCGSEFEHGSLLGGRVVLLSKPLALLLSESVCNSGISREHASCVHASTENRMVTTHWIRSLAQTKFGIFVEAALDGTVLRRSRIPHQSAFRGRRSRHIATYALNDRRFTSKIDGRMTSDKGTTDGPRKFQVACRPTLYCREFRK